MVVADAGLIVALVSRHEFTADAEETMHIESEWIVPPLWRAEVRNVLAKRFRLEKALTKDQAQGAYRDASLLLENAIYDIDFRYAMERTLKLGISGYDAEYLELAEARKIRRVSAKERLVKHLQSKRVRTAVFLKDYVGSVPKCRDLIITENFTANSIEKMDGFPESLRYSLRQKPRITVFGTSAM